MPRCSATELVELEIDIATSAQFVIGADYYNTGT
jgi:hypothetical protein